jgi:hypothetical protein
MEKFITCIFCESESKSTDEHVVPEFAGGSLIINAVCKTCNDRMGSDFEGPLSNNIIFRLPRALHNIRGKSKDPINPFPGTGSTPEGNKIRADDGLKPYLIPEVNQHTLSPTSIQLSYNLDASDVHKLPELVRLKTRRAVKKEWPDLSPEQIDAIVEKAASELPAELEIQQSRPTAHYTETIDIGNLELLMMKIAYEISFHHHGSDVLQDPQVDVLRKAIHTRNSREYSCCRLYPEPDPFLSIISPQNSHCIILAGGICYIRLYSISAIIKLCEQDSSYFVTSDNWAIYLFNYATKTYEKHTLLGYLANPTV